MTNIYEKTGTFDVITLTDHLRSEIDSAVGCRSIDGGVSIDTPDVVTESQVDVALGTYVYTLNSYDQLETASIGINDLRSTAATNAPFIKQLMVDISGADVAGSDMGTRWSALIATMTNTSITPTGVLTRFKQALIAEENIDVDSIGVPSLTDAQKRTILAFARRFANTWATILIS